MTCDGNCGACAPVLTRAPNQPEGGEAVLYGDVWVKPWTLLDAGMWVPSHAHTYDHTSFLASGTIRVWQDETFVGEFTGPVGIRIPALTKHTFETVTPALVLCIHNAAHGEAADIHEEHVLALEG